MVIEAPTRAETRIARSPRLSSLDIVRGAMLVVSVISSSVLAPPDWYGHAEWTGVHLEDLIFPTFVVLSGAGLALSMQRRVRLVAALRRAALLFVIGVVYNCVLAFDFSPGSWRFTGVLQLYAVVTLVLALLGLVVRNWRGWLIACGAFALAHTALLVVSAQTCPDRLITPDCNPSGMWDPLLFGGHLYWGGALGYDAEGAISMLGALICATAGAAVARALAAAHAAGLPRLAVIRVLSISAGLGAAALLTHVAPLFLFGVDIPVMKKLWTAPFALSVAAGVGMVLLAAYLFFDARRRGPLVPAADYGDVEIRRADARSITPLIALGRNSLIVYFGSHVLVSLLTRPATDGGSDSVADALFAVVPSWDLAQLILSVALLGLWVGLATLLHSRRWYLRL